MNKDQENILYQIRNSSRATNVLGAIAIYGLNELSKSTEQLKLLKTETIRLQNELKSIQIRQADIALAQLEVQELILLQQKLQTALLLESEVNRQRQKDLKSSLYKIKSRLNQISQMNDPLLQYYEIISLNKVVNNLSINPDDLDDLTDKEYASTVLKKLESITEDCARLLDTGYKNDIDIVENVEPKIGQIRDNVRLKYQELSDLEYQYEVLKKNNKRWQWFASLIPIKIIYSVLISIIFLFFSILMSNPSGYFWFKNIILTAAVVSGIVIITHISGFKMKSQIGKQFNRIIKSYFSLLLFSTLCLIMIYISINTHDGFLIVKTLLLTGFIFFILNAIVHLLSSKSKYNIEIKKHDLINLQKDFSEVKNEFIDRIKNINSTYKRHPGLKEFLSQIG